MEIGKHIKQLRLRHGITQEAMAQHLNVTAQAISKWETLDAMPELSKLKSLCDVFGVTADWMISEDEPDETPGQKPVKYPDRISRFDELTDKIADGAEKIFKKYKVM